MKIKLIEIVKNIRRNIASFLSILIFIFLAVTLYEGLSFTGQAVKYSMDRTIRETNSFDLKVLTGAFFTKEEGNKFLSIDGIDEAECFYSADDDFEYKGETFSANVSSITSTIAKCEVVEGRLPENDNEIVVYRGCAKEFEFKIGDEITFTRGDLASFSQVFLNDFDNRDISTIIDSSSYHFIDQTFTICGIVLTPNMTNHEISTHPIDSKTGVAVEAAFYVNYSAFNPLITGNKYNGVYLKSNELSKYKFFEQNYIDRCEELSEKVNNLIGDGFDISTDYVSYIEQHHAIYLALKEYLIQEELLDDTFNDDELIEVINTFLETLTVKESIHIVNSINKTSGPMMSLIMAGLFNDEKVPIGGVFFLISLLICYSVVTRLVSNDIKIIGTKKVLGFKQKEIVSTYLAFTFIAVILALILGNVAAIGFEKLVTPIVFKKAFNVLLFTDYFDILIASIIALLSLSLLGVITYIGCASKLRKRGIVLLQGDAPTSNNKNGLLEKSKLFQKASLFYKTIVRNFRHDFKRIFATVIGISSSVALLISSFSLKFTVQESFDTQFKSIYSYDTVVYTDINNEEAQNNIGQFLEENSLKHTPIFRDYTSFTLEDEFTYIGYIYVYFDNDTFNELVNIKPSEGNPKFENKGFWFPESYQKEYKCKNTANVAFFTSKGEHVNIQTTGFFKYYSYQGAFYVDNETYDSYFNTTIEPNAFLVNRNKQDLKTLEEQLKDVDGFYYTYDTYGKAQQDVSVFDLVCNVLFSLYFTATLLLSVFVVLNLFITYIKEKKKELLTLMVNGYSRGQSSKYIYLDTIFLTIFSLILGTGLGIVLAWYGQMMLESQFLYFIHGPNLLAIILANLITAVLVVIMTLISLREIKKFRLKDINAE